MHITTRCYSVSHPGAISTTSDRRTQLHNCSSQKQPGTAANRISEVGTGLRAQRTHSYTRACNFERSSTEKGCSASISAPEGNFEHHNDGCEGSLACLQLRENVRRLFKPPYHRMELTLAVALTTTRPSTFTPVKEGASAPIGVQVMSAHAPVQPGASEMSTIFMSAS